MRGLYEKRGIHRGIRGGSRGDPGPKRGIHGKRCIAKPMKTGGSTASSSALYNIKSGTEARRPLRCRILPALWLPLLTFGAARMPLFVGFGRSTHQNKNIRGTRPRLSQTGAGSCLYFLSTKPQKPCLHDAVAQSVSRTVIFIK